MLFVRNCEDYELNREKIILLIDYKRMKMYSFLAEEREAVQKTCDLLNELSDENGQLKEENERLQEHIRLLTDCNQGDLNE